MLDKLFKFPIIMVDMDEEEKKRKLDLPSDDGEYDIIYGEAEYPYFDFIAIEDRWLPNTESRARAREGKFDACLVTFANTIPKTVPWTRAKFKKELNKFYESIAGKEDKEEDIDMTVIRISPEQLSQLIKPKDDKEENG